MPLKPRAPVLTGDRDLASATLIVAAPAGAFHFNADATAPMLPRVVPFERVSFASVHDFQRTSFESVDDFYGFAPRPSEPILPRMVTADELLGARPSLGRRIARVVTSFAAACAVLVSVLAALVLVLSWTFKVPLKASNASYAGIVALTELGPVEREVVIVAPLDVQPHAQVLVPPTPRAKTAMPASRS